MLANEDRRVRSLTKVFLSLAIVCISLAIAGAATGQTSSVSHIDDSIFTARRHQYAKKIRTLPNFGDRVVAVGKLFLGTPYVAGTLDLDSANEELIVNLHGLDCVTFYENALVLARIDGQDIRVYKKQLTLLRYRDGIMNGFHSRLNYTTDYFRNAVKKGVMQNVTRIVGGNYQALDTAKIDFMTKHRSLYKQIARNDNEFRAIQKSEDDLNAEGGFSYIPKKDIEKVEAKIHSGDILGITTDFPGLDCSHTGIAVRMKDGRIHFMEASSLEHKVIITPEPLSEYLTHSARQTGVVVMRPIELDDLNGMRQ